MINRFLLSALIAGALLRAWPASGQTADAGGGNAGGGGHLVAPPVSAEQTQKLALPTDFSIHLRDVTLREALLELQKQSGLTFNFANLSAQTQAIKMSIDIDTPSLQRALDAVADEADVKITLTHSWTLADWDLKTDRGDAPKKGPTSADGLFAVRLTGLNVTLFQSLDLDGAATPARTQNDNLNLALWMAPDPGVPLVGKPRLRVISAQDDKGRSLLKDKPDKAAPDYDSGFQDIWSQPQMTLQLRPPAADAKTIAHLEGEALYLVVAKRDRWEVPDALNAKNATHDYQIGDQTVHVKLQKVEKNGEKISFTIELTLPPGIYQDEASRAVFALYTVESWCSLEDANGRILSPQGGGGSTGQGHISASASFDPARNPNGQAGDNAPPKLALPLKFIFEPPSQLVQARTIFQFDNVPLP